MGDYREYNKRYQQSLDKMDSTRTIIDEANKAEQSKHKEAAAFHKRLKKALGQDETEQSVDNLGTTPTKNLTPGKKKKNKARKLLDKCKN